MTTALEKLKNRAKENEGSSRAGTLFRWLTRNFANIEELRGDKITWREIAQAAEQDGIEIGVTRADLRRLEKKWRLVRKARTSAELRRLDAEILKEAKRANALGKPLMPSRLSPSWRPEIVETQSQDGQLPAGRGTSLTERPPPQQAAPTSVTPYRKKNALAKTNFHSVASSDAEMTSALPEGKTLADIAADEVEREMRITANRHAGYFGDK